MDNSKEFLGIKVIDGTAEDFDIRVAAPTNGYIYFVRTDPDGEDGYIYFDNKKYGNTGKK